MADGPDFQPQVSKSIEFTGKMGPSVTNARMADFETRQRVETEFGNLTEVAQNNPYGQQYLAALTERAQEVSYLDGVWAEKSQVQFGVKEQPAPTVVADTHSKMAPQKPGIKAPVNKV